MPAKQLELIESSQQEKRKAEMYSTRQGRSKNSYNNIRE